MREIKFRGWHKMDGWVYGYYAVDDNGNHLIYGIDPDDGSWGAWIVEPNSVGQYTGIKDCNSKEIYEGDIVHVTDFFHGDSEVYKGVVKFVGGYYQIEGQDIRNAPLGWIISSDDLEVIGNIYENPELAGEA